MGIGSTVISPFGEIYVIRGGENGWRAEHVPGAEQMILDELLAVDADAA
jgi:hypothetical protein